MKKETKKAKQQLQNAYINELHQEITKRGINNSPTIKPLKDDYELNKKIIRSYERKIPKTVKNRIKKDVYT